MKDPPFDDDGEREQPAQDDEDAWNSQDERKLHVAVVARVVRRQTHCAGAVTPIPCAMPRFPLGDPPPKRSLEVLVACWSVKGGSGTTVVAASLALLMARQRVDAVTFVDLAGDASAVFGVAEPRGPGVTEWADAGDDLPAAALGALASPVRDGLRMVHRGSAPIPATSGERIAVAVASLGTAVVDCGQLSSERVAFEAASAIASGATQSLLVMRPCFLSLRAAIAAPIRPSGVVLVHDQRRALGKADVEDVLGVPVRAEVTWDAAIARAVDAGLLATSLPSPLCRDLRAAAA